MTLNIHEEVMQLAARISGAAQEENPLLDSLCSVHEARILNRLLPDVLEEATAAAVCAAAFAATADLLDARENAAEFHAGEVSFRMDASARSAALRERAEALTAPYTVAADFAFRGVRA